MKKIALLAKGVLLISIPLILIILNANVLTTRPYMQLSKGAYDSHEDIYYDHDYAIDRIMGYLNYRYDDLLFGIDETDDSVIMRDVEIRHMVDVKNVYTFLRIIALGGILLSIAAIVFLLKTKQKDILIDTLDKMWIGPVFFIMFVGSYILIDFNAAFTAFHKIFFTNDDWILRSNDVLILLLPTTFWMVSGLVILGFFILELITIYFINNKVFKERL